MYNNDYNPAVVQNSAPKVQNDTSKLRVAFAQALNRDIVKAKFKEVLNKNAEGFMSRRSWNPLQMQGSGGEPLQISGSGICSTSIRQRY